ncbi:hypothetical protein [Nocardioides sp.]|uniref:hypothetical protein n=1 Tax=Nocardioides sp. TaxID=35761 RepID=UPI002B26C338|nr:hypothetical protein [Nocardioides sp.]
MTRLDLPRRFLDSSSPLPLDVPFTAATAGAEGVTGHRLTWLTQQGYLRRLIKGVYVSQHVPDSTALRCAALGLVVPEDCVIVDRHAGWLHGAEMVLAPNEHINLQPISVFRPSGMGRLRNGLVDSGERNLLDRDITELNGLRVATPLRTACDLGRVRWTDRGIAGLDAMLRLGVFGHVELLAEVERYRGMRWVRTLRVLAPLADGRAESPGESVLRLHWIGAGLPTPEPQFIVWRSGRILAIIDLASGAICYAAEYDGREWHSSPEQVEHDLERRGELRSEGWVIDVFECDDLFSPHCDPQARLRAGAREAALRLGISLAS